MTTKLRQDNSVPANVTSDQRREFQRIVGLFIYQFSSLQTRRIYTFALRELFLFIGHTNLDQVKSEEVVRYKEYITAKGNSIETVARKISTIRSFFRWAEEQKFITSNCTKVIRPPKISGEGKTPELSDAEVRRLLEAPNRETIVGHRDLLILSFLFYFGLRSAELVNIKLKDFTREAGYDVLNILGKGNHRRRIPVRPELIFEMQKYCERLGPIENNSFLFTPSVNNRGKILTNKLKTETIRQIVIKYAKRAGISHRVTSHSGRVTACSNAAENSATTSALMESFGWRSPSTSQRYERRRGNLKNSALHRIVY
jgi:site-specific recombinase XerD